MLTLTRTQHRPQLTVEVASVRLVRWQVQEASTREASWLIAEEESSRGRLALVPPGVGTGLIPEQDLGSWNLLWWFGGADVDLLGEPPDVVRTIHVSPVLELLPPRYSRWAFKVHCQALSEWQAALKRADAAGAHEEAERLRRSIGLLAEPDQDSPASKNIVDIVAALLAAAVAV